MWDQIASPADPRHVAAVVELARRAEPGCGDTVVVAIDGRSGAGKTTLAAGVAQALAALGTVEVVHMDHLYPGWEGLSAAPGLLATTVLEPIAHGDPAAYPVWSWVRGDWAGTRTVRPSRYLVVEGCGSSVGPAGPYAAVRVWMEADRPLRFRRGIDRDGETYEPMWELWAAQEEALFEDDRTKARADLVLDTSTL
ncbi:para-aminobenzoate synthase [Intrasporangium oryzae NRRL B-24470]|uniref:Para-aminobenzoate synthase n=1 Tax=Intrasporangium oryzae NRRL B-24470 TaxID=1386089 RepID=W9GCF2_9MICO|nr:para-aminobenzoate synthase [Intrasporangium oryzae]EWT02912.1 para-aminobenzoate synthase [Intrasporangium oryzae NRRL B-24470]